MSEEIHPLEPVPEYGDDWFVGSKEIGNFITDKLGLVGDRHQFDFILYVEAIILTIISVYVSFLFVAAESGILSLCLVAGALTPRINQILDLNRHNIWVAKKGPIQANRKSVVSLISLALGVFLGFFIVAFAADPEVISRRFGTILTLILMDSHMIEWDFNFQSSLYGHTVGFLAAMMLAFLYKAFGAMLVITLNTCGWAIYLVQLLKRGAADVDVTSVMYYLSAIVTFLPHMFFVFAAYVIISMAAIFLSKGLVRYAITEKRFYKVVLAVFPIAILGVVCLIVAVCLQSFYIPWMLSLL